MTSKLVVNTIEADTGISSVSFASSISMSSTSKFHFSAAGIDIDADTNINRPAAGVLGFNINSSEKVRITSAGNVGIGTAVPEAASNYANLSLADTTGGQIELKRLSDDTKHYIWGNANLNIAGGYANGASSSIRFYVNGANERLRITSDGSIGINATTPSAGDMASGASFAAPKLHVLGNNTQSGAYELLARFQSGTDADNTGATIVLNHANDRGLAIQGGRRTGNYAHGALKMVDNVGRLSDAMLIHGGAGQGVDHINFYTGVSTTTTNRLHIDSSGRVLIGTTNNSNGHIAASNLAVQGADLSIFKDSGGDNTGVSGHKLKFVTQSGSLGEIDVLSEGGGGPSGRGGSMRFYTKQNNVASATARCIITSTGDFNTYHDTNDEGMFVRNTANNAAIRIYASGGSPSGAFSIALNGPTDALQIDRTDTSGAYSDNVLSVYSNRAWKRAPIGTIINVGYARHDPDSDSYSAIASNTRASSAAYLDFTPIRSDSKLIIMTRMHTRIIAAHGCSYGIEVSTNSGSSYTDVDGMIQRNAMDFFYKSDAVNHHYTGFCMRQIDAYS